MSDLNWLNFSNKLLARIENPISMGYFTPQNADARMMRLAVGKEGDLAKGDLVQLYFLVDLSDGVIADAKFQVFGPPALIGAAESACELVLRKNYEQARRLTTELIEKQMRDRDGECAFPKEADWALNFVLDAIDKAAEQCMDIPIADAYLAPPISPNEIGEQREYPGWKELTSGQKIAVLEEVIAQDIRAYIELDAGGVQVIDFIGESEVIISYQGACTSCHSATGATLNSIQEILRAKVSPDLMITPRL